MRYITVRLSPGILHCLLISQGQHGDTVAFRLTRIQASLIRRGLDFLATNYVTRQQKKSAQFAYPFAMYPPPADFDRGTYAPEMMRQVLSVRRALSRKVKGGRVRLNAIQIRAAIFAVRLNTRIAGLGVREAAKEKWGAERKQLFRVDADSIARLRHRCKRTIHSLERHMKRANRLMHHGLTAEQYKGASGAWQAHLRWMRIHFAFFKVLPVVVGRKKQHQEVLDILVDVAGYGVRDSGFQAPDDGELRRLMRMYLRYCRLGRQRTTYLEILRRYPRSYVDGTYLADFVAKRIKLERLP